MLALLASFALVAYIVVPGWIFRATSAVFLPAPLKKFHRTRSQELAFGTVVAVIPFILALGISWWLNWPLGVIESNRERRADYKLMYEAATSTASFDQQLKDGTYWRAATHVVRRQTRLLIWVWLFAMLEGLAFARFTSNYWKLKAGPLGRISEVLLKGISPWHVLLTDFALDPSIPRKVHADVMTHPVLYKGEVADYSLDDDGELSGITLRSPHRYDREGYLDDKKTDRQLALKWGMVAVNRVAKDRADYWRSIPSEILYIPAKEIANINVRHVAVEEEKAVIARAKQIGLVVTPEPAAMSAVAIDPTVVIGNPPAE